MSLQQRLIPLENRLDWQRALTGIPHAFAHTWESCHAMHLSTGYPTFLYVGEKGEDRVLCPLAERHFSGYVDIVTPYGFGGFVGQADENTLASWRDFSCQQEWVSAFIGLNPLFVPDVCCQQLDYSEYNDIFVVDLSRGLNELHWNLSPTRRRQIDAAFSNTEWLLEDREQLATFFLNHVSKFLEEKAGGRSFVFSCETLEALLSLDNTLLFGGGRLGRVDVVSVFAYTPYCAEYLFNVSLKEGRSLSAAVLWSAVKKLHSIGVPLLNLGGGIRRGDGVARFKRRFGAKQLPLGSLRSVFRHDVYNSLCSRTGSDLANQAAYFPAYRRNLPLAVG